MRRKRLAHFAVAALPAIALVAYACTQPLTLDDVLVRPSSMSAVGAASFTATAGTVVQNPARVRVLDQDNTPLPNWSITFAASRGTLSSTTVTTDAQGEATPPSWTAPNQSGPATITASITGFTVGNVVFAVTVAAGPTASIAVQPASPSSNNQSAIAGTAVALPPAVLVADQFANGIPDKTVAFTVLTGGGTLNGSATTVQVTTDANGIAKPTSWVLGPTVGTNTLGATTNALAGQSVTFTATGTVGPVNKIVIAPPGNSQNQSTVGGTSVPVAPAVLVTDVNNNPISGVVARFTVASGGGKALANSGDATGSNSLDATTSASGIATIFGWKLGVIGTNPAAQSLSVTIPSAGTVAPFAINATATAGAPASITSVVETPSSNNQSALVNTTVAVAPGVVVKDANTNVVANTSVTFTVRVDVPSGSIKPTSSSPPVGTANVTTDANGVARLFSWTLGSKGLNNLTAAVTANTSIFFTFTATGTAGPPASIAIVSEAPSSNNQATVAGTATPVAPAVIVKDANGVPVDAGINISFTITTGGGVVSATGCTGTATTVTTATDANGIARLGCWKPGTVGTNANTLRAAVVGTPALFVDFTATGTVGPPTQISFTNQPWPFTRQNFVNGGVPMVTVKDAGGNGVSGLTVDWSNGGNANSTVAGTTSSTTDASGVAQFQGLQGGTWTAAVVPSGSTMTLQASVAATSLTASTTSTVVTEPTAIVAVASPPATTTVNAVVSPNPVLEFRDGSAGARPVPGQDFTWTYPTNPSSNGTIVNPVIKTDSLGRANPGTWKVSQTAGVNTIQASIPGLSISFSTTGVASSASQIAVNGGNNQSTTTSTAVTTPPSVIVRDQFSNGVSGVSVTFSPASGSGTVTGSPATTNASGIATAGSWTLGSSLGPQTLNAFVTSTPSLTVPFTATATGAVTKLGFTMQPPTNAGYLIDMTPSVRVAAQDASGNTVTSYSACIQLTLSTNPSGATLIGGDPINTVDGVATFPGLRIDRPASGYVLTATQTCGTGTPTAALSQAFNVSSTGTVVPSSGLKINGMVLDGSTIYFTESGAASGKVKKVSANGGTVTELAGSLSQPVGIVSDGTNVYWIETADGATGQGRVGRMSVNGGPVSTVAGGLTITNGGHWLFADGSDLFFLAGNTIKKIAASATLGSATNHVQTVGTPYFTLNAGNIYYSADSVVGSVVYWADLRKIPTTGGSPSVVTNDFDIFIGNDRSMVVAADRVYFYAWRSGTQCIRSAPITGGSVTNHTCYQGNSWFATDGLSMYAIDFVWLYRYPLDFSGSTQLSSTITGSPLLLDSQSLYYQEGFNIRKRSK